MTNYFGTSGSDNVSITGDPAGSSNYWDFSQGGYDTLTSGAADDTFYFGSRFNTPTALSKSQDFVNGGAGYDTLILAGNYTNHASGGLFTFGALKLTLFSLLNVEELRLMPSSASGATAYDITLSLGTVPSGQTMRVWSPPSSGGSSGPIEPAPAPGSIHIDASACAGNLVFGVNPDRAHGAYNIGLIGNLVGGSGADVFGFADSSQLASGTYDGGAGSDTVDIGEDVIIAIGDPPSPTFTLGSNFHSIETLLLRGDIQGGPTSMITVADSVVDAGAVFTVVGSSGSTPLTNLNFDGRAETDGHFNLMGGTSSDILYGGAMSDTLNGGTGADRLNGGGGADSMIGGTGNDIFYVDNAGDVTVESTFNGGTDTVFASVSYTLKALQAVESLATNSAAGTTSIDLGGNEYGQTITGNAGANRLSGGGGNDILVGNAGDDWLSGGAGRDTISPGTGNDTVAFKLVSESTGSLCDIVDGMDLGHDRFDFSVVPKAIHSPVTHGALSITNFDAYLAADVGAKQMGAHEAVLFTPDGGTLAGHHYLIVDANGVAGYQAGADYVVELTGRTAGTLTLADFI